MELSFLTLKSAVTNYNSVVAFIDGRGMTDILATIGDVHYVAAKDALEKRSISVNKRVPVQSAITHLEAAHVSFKRIYQSHRYFRIATWMLAGFKDVWTLALMATCYMYLNELELAKQKAKEAQQVLHHVQNPPRNPHFSGGGGFQYRERAPEDLAAPSTFLNPIEWFKVPSLVHYWIGDERSNQLNEFCATINRHSPATFCPWWRLGSK